MNDIEVIFNGPYGKTYINLEGKVSGKQVTAQKVLINLATQQGTDKLYPDKGTNLLKQCIGAVMVNENAAQHISNFAALDTLYFINETDNLEVEDPTGLANVDLKLAGYDATTGQVSFASTVYFPDDTQTETSYILNLNNG